MRVVVVGREGSTAMRASNRVWGLPLVLLLAIFLAGTPASAAVDRRFAMDRGERESWVGQSKQLVTNYNYWDTAGLGAIGPVATTTCTKDATTYCEQILVELRNPVTVADEAAGDKIKSAPVTVWLDGFGTLTGPVNDFDLLVYESDPSGARGKLIASDGNLQNTNKELVQFSVGTDVSTPSAWVLIDVVYYQVVNGGYSGHIHF